MQNSGAVDVPLPSERKFGLLFACIGLGLAAWGTWVKHWPQGVVWALVGVGAVCGVLALVAPTALRPLNRAWFSLGLLLGRIVNPLVMGVIFYLLITPVALVTRLFGRDVLRLKRRQVNTYWVDRVPDANEQAESFKHQF